MGSKLKSQPIEVEHGKLFGITNAAIVHLENGNKAVFKKHYSNCPRYGRNEVLAYRISKSLKINMVPETAPAVVEGVEGIMSAWANAETELTIRNRRFLEFSKVENPSPHELYKAAAFDYLISNGDRHLGNFMRDTKGHLVLIDHAFSMESGRPAISDLICFYGDHMKYSRKKRMALAKRLERLDTNKLATEFDLDIVEASSFEQRRRDLIGAIRNDSLTALWRP